MNELPLEELKQKLAERFDEVTLLELLGVDSEMLVSRFSDLIEDDQEKFLAVLDEVGLEGYEEYE